jgi:hypothetical protein
MTYNLAAAQGLEPEETEEQEHEQPSIGGQQSGIGQIGSSLHDTFGQRGTFAMRPAPLQQGQFSPGGASFGGSTPRANPIVPPGESDRAVQINAHTAGQVAAFHGSRQAPLNGRSAQDYQRATFGGPTS